jgi:hypothetical protein
MSFDPSTQVQAFVRARHRRGCKFTDGARIELVQLLNGRHVMRVCQPSRCPSCGAEIRKGHSRA